MAKLFFNSITDDLDGVCGITYLIKKIGFEFNENEIDEVLGDKWKNEESVIEELFGKQVAAKRKKLNLENKDSIGVKKIENNIRLQPGNDNNNQNNSGNGNKLKNRKWAIYLCLILSVCIIIFSFIFSFWILLCLSLSIGYLVFRFYKLNKLKDTKQPPRYELYQCGTKQFSHKNTISKINLSESLSEINFLSQSYKINNNAHNIVTSSGEAIFRRYPK